MKYPFFFTLSLALILQSCQPKNKTTEMPTKEIFNCSNGSMNRAWYELGRDDSTPPIKTLNNGFLIVVDSNYKATNFVSSIEDYLRNEAENLDKSVKKSHKKIDSEKAFFLNQADSVHRQNNHGQNQVWIINNTTDTVSIQMQDWSYICIMQARTKSGQWLPIQYWRFSWCGNSYYDKVFLPKTANSFITTIPNKGNYETTLRFKLLGTGKFYYSNEFTGKINYCDFVEDSTTYSGRINQKPNYKLDTMINLTRPILRYKK